MFDMGFEPQISVMLNHTRPDRQTVMFSATFPPIIEKLARKTLVLIVYCLWEADLPDCFFVFMGGLCFAFVIFYVQVKPIEIVIGGRSVVSSSITQIVEVYALYICLFF